MNNANQKNLMEQLLDQELPLTNEQYLAYRRRVTDGIRKVQREARTMRIVTKSAWAVTGVVFLIDAIIDFNRDAFPEMVRLSLIFPTTVCLACAAAFLAFYLINYRPRLRNVEQEAILLSLHRQLHELRSQLAQGADRPPAAHGKDTLPKG
jgi:hypothetical protein